MSHDLRTGSKERVRVVCRIRPLNAKESAFSNYGNCIKISSETHLDIVVDETSHPYQFDRVFGPDSDQLSVFEYTAIPLIQDVLKGYNATIFAYGQTGTGKTHTMEGRIHNSADKGIIPRVVEALFTAVTEADESIEFTFKVTYVEIYMEKIRDLLDESKVKVNLTIREDKIKGIYVAGVTEEYVTSHTELLDIMSIGSLNRATAATGMNEGSSRSHSVFTVTVNQKDTRSGIIKSGKLVLVDLAGSEMVRKSGSEGRQLEEAKTINKSLSALGQVINALTDEKQTHVPYRDSKLTRILQDSLGGNSKTVLIIALSPSSYNATESHSTIRFGVRAKGIENKVTVNQSRSPEELETLLIRAENAIDSQTAHILALTAELQAVQASKNGHFNGTVSNTDKAFAAELARVEAQQTIIAQMEEATATLSQELEEERAEGIRKDSETEALTMRLKEKEKFLIEAGELLVEAQKHYETQRNKAEQLMREKAAVIGEYQSIQDTLQAELDKAKFDLSELEVTTETLRIENKQMVQEISEISGDAAVERSATPRQNALLNRNAINPDAFGSTYTTDPDSSPRDLSLNLTASTNGKNSMAYTMDSVLMEVEDVRAERTQQGRTLVEALTRGAKVDKKASEALVAWMNGQEAHTEKMYKAYESKLAHMERLYKDHSKRLRDMEVQRRRLEGDLMNRSLKVTQLNIEMSDLQLASGETARDMVSEREKTLSKSLQQRLEQLVAIHRQLLRKFAMLELENGESKKKIQLRDERIRQLENSSRSLTGNMRNQAERHVSELTCLREQIQILRLEHQERLDSQRAFESRSNGGGGGGVRSNTANTPGGAMRSVRGGNHIVPDDNIGKSVRGGNNHFIPGISGGNLSGAGSPSGPSSPQTNTRSTPNVPKGNTLSCSGLTASLDEYDDEDADEGVTEQSVALKHVGRHGPETNPGLERQGSSNRLSGILSRVLGASK